MYFHLEYPYLPLSCLLQSLRAQTVSPELTTAWLNGNIESMPPTLGQIYVPIGQPVSVSIAGQNSSSTSANFGGIDLEIPEVNTKSGNQITLTVNSTGALNVQNTWWPGVKLPTGQTATYVHVESEWQPWSGLTSQTLAVSLTFLQPGQYTIYAKLYLNDPSGSNFLSPSGSGTNETTDEQGQYVFDLGTFIAVNPPTVTTLGPTNVTSTSAALNASVDPNGGNTTCFFQYGTSTSYSSSTQQYFPGSGNSNLGVVAPISGLTPGVIYHYRVVAVNAGGTVYGSDVSFQTSPLSPMLSSPSNGATVSTSPTLSWNVSTGALSYHLQVSTSSSFGATVYDNSNITNTSQAISALNSGMTYYWRVSASNSGGTSAYSSPWSFTTVATPVPPTLLSPTSGATVSTNPTLIWHAPTGATSYHLQVSTNSTFATLVYDNASITGTSQAVNSLNDGTTYFWQVSASNVAGTSAYSSPWSFNTALLPPTANAATNITTSGFTANWSSSSGAGGYWLDVSTTSNFTSYVSGYQNLDVGNTLTKNVTGLNPGTTYYYQVRASNGAESSGNSNTQTVTTNASAPGAPTVTTAAASGVATTSATLNGTVNPNGSSTTCYFQYGTTISYGSVVPPTLPIGVGSGNSVVAVAAGLTGLTPATTYHYRLVAASSGGTTNGTDMTFTTSAPSPVAPTVTTTAASNVTTTTATLNGTVNPNGASTTYYFQHGTTTSYESTTTSTSAGSGASNETESTPITGLTPGTTYHYRIVASNAGGTTNGNDITFTTMSSQLTALVAYYPFNDTPNDSSGNGNDGTVVGGVTYGFGRQNAACELDGRTGYIIIPNSGTLQSPTNAISLCGWMKINSWPGLQVAAMVSKTTTSNYGQYELNYQDWDSRVGPEISFIINTNNGGRGLTTYDTLNFGTWYFLAATWDGDSAKMYVNGDFKGGDTLTGVMIPDTNSLVLGLSTPGTYTLYLDGSLDEIRIYNTALTQHCVDSLYGLATGIENKPHSGSPAEFQLSQNFPNPFNPSTIITYQLPSNAAVVLKVYDILGREVATLVNECEIIGNHSVTFNAGDLPSGVYSYRLQAGTYSQTKKLLLLK